MLPEEVNFGWAVFDVELVDGPLLSEGEEVYGDVDLNEYKIRIDNRPSEKIQMETFFHEIFHVLLEMSGAGHETSLNPDNETLTTYLSRHFMSVLYLNPWINFDRTYCGSPFTING